MKQAVFTACCQCTKLSLTIIVLAIHYLSLKLSSTAFAFPGCKPLFVFEDKKLEKPAGVVGDSFLNAIDQSGNSRRVIACFKSKIIPECL